MGLTFSTRFRLRGAYKDYKEYENYVVYEDYKDRGLTRNLSFTRNLSLIFGFHLGFYSTRIRPSRLIGSLGDLIEALMAF